MVSSWRQLPAAALLLSLSFSTAFAKPTLTSLPKRQATADDGSSQVLEPIVPPNVDPNDPDVLAPSKNVTLFFQSPATSRKRDGAAVVAQVAFDFKYPTVALDHSNNVGNVSCTGDSVVASFADGDSYQQAARSWPTKSTLMLITSTSGCGSNDTSNGYFVAASAAFDSKTNSITAKGSFSELNGTYDSMSITWGAGSAQTTDDADNKLQARRCDDDWCGSKTFSFEVNPEIAAGMLKGQDYDEARANQASEDDPNAPWPHAFKLWGANTSDKKKRSLETRDGFEGGFNLYCVDCGINGEFTVGGAITYHVFSSPHISKAQAYFNGNMHAGLFLGLEAHAHYQKEWEKELLHVKLVTSLADINLNRTDLCFSLVGWKIPFIVSIGPYIGLDLKATFEAKAKGSVLVGGALDWPGFSATLDLVNGDNSGADGFAPQLTQKFEAKGEVSVEASLGLPLSLGLEIDVANGLWNAHASLVDSPSITAEASISGSYTNDNNVTFFDGSSTPSSSNGLDVNDSCYGVDWQIFLKNTLTFEAEADPFGKKEWTLFDNTITLGQGCLGYEKPACSSPVRASPIVANGVNCNMLLDSIAGGHAYGDALVLDSRKACAQKCMRDNKCLSFSWANESHSCQLLDTGFGNLGGNGGSNYAVFDRNCWETKDCLLPSTQQKRSALLAPGMPSLM